MLGWPRAPAMWSLPSSESLGPGLCQLSALKTGEHATKPSFKGSPRPPPKPSLGLAHPFTYPPPSRHTPTASAKAPNRVRARDAKRGGGPTRGREEALRRRGEEGGK